MAEQWQQLQARIDRNHDEPRVGIAWHLLAEGYRASEGQPMPIRRALAFQRLLDDAPIVITPEDLYAGNCLGHFPLAQECPLSTEELDADRQHVLSLGGPITDWRLGFDHANVNYAKLLQMGWGGLLRQVRAELESLPPHGESARRERNLLESLAIACQAASRYTARHAAAAQAMAEAAADPQQRQRLLEVATTCRAVAVDPPRTFRQAVQLFWLAHLILGLETRGAMAPGRLDQYLWPFLARDLATGEVPELGLDVHSGGLEDGATVAEDGRPTAFGLLMGLWPKFGEVGLPNPIQNVAVGGQTRQGEDATNPLSYLCLAATRALRRPYPNLSARCFSGTPRQFLLAVAQTIKAGVGFPAVFNDDVLVPAIQRLGVAPEDARDYCLVGCVETFIGGKQAPWSDGRVDMLRALEHALNDGRSRLTGEQESIRTGDPARFASLGEVKDAFKRQFVAYMDRYQRQLEDARSRYSPGDDASPFLSLLTDDCIARHRDVNDGGAVYPSWHGPGLMGISSLADSLAAIGWAVFGEGPPGGGWLTMPRLLQLLSANFAGAEAERLRLLNGAPKVGNDDPYVDDILEEMSRFVAREVLRRTAKDGVRLTPLFAGNVNNVFSGKTVGATPDGRRAREPVSDAASPCNGRDRHGPTAIIRSVTRNDFGSAVGGAVLNLSFHPSVYQGRVGTERFADLLRAYLDMGGSEVQINVLTRDTLLDARAHPERYRRLVVRVSGFSAYFVELDPDVQEDILRRTVQTAA